MVEADSKSSRYSPNCQGRIAERRAITDGRTGFFPGGKQTPGTADSRLIMTIRAQSLASTPKDRRNLKRGQGQTSSPLASTR